MLHNNNEDYSSLFALYPVLDCLRNLWFDAISIVECQETVDYFHGVDCMFEAHWNLGEYQSIYRLAK